MTDLRPGTPGAPADVADAPVPPRGQTVPAVPVAPRRRRRLRYGVVTAVFVGAVAALLGWPARVAVAAMVGGIVGSTADSVIGATLQARRRCPRCNLATERLVHSCGAPTAHAGGVSWLTNDGVNAVSSAIGAAASIWGGLG